MKTFKGAKWDVDADNDTFQELFKKPKKHKSKIEKQSKKAKYKLKNFKNKIKKHVSKNLKTSHPVNLIKSPTSNDVIVKKQKPKVQKNKTVRHDSHQNNVSNILQNNGKLKNKKKMDKNQSTEVIKSVNLHQDEQNISKSKKKRLKTKLKKKMNHVSDHLHYIDNLNLATEVKQRKHIQNTSVSVETKQIDNNIKRKKRLKNKLKVSTGNIVHSNKVVINSFTEKNKKDESFSAQLLGQPSFLQKTKKKEKLFEKLKYVLNNSTKQKKPEPTLRQKMMERLKSARFRFINEQIYSADSKEAQKIFMNDSTAFKAYHDGYRRQVKNWPMNPLDVIIESITKMPKNHIIADLGCGDARLSKSVTQKVHSFDLVAADDTVIATDMSNVPLETSSVDVVVFCLSLMGTNLRDYLFEANRILKIGGVLKVAEVESRFENVEDFVKGVLHFGFKITWKDLSHNLFYFLDFKKERDVKNKNKLHTLSLLPCLYKKR